MTLSKAGELKNESAKCTSNKLLILH